MMHVDSWFQILVCQANNAGLEHLGFSDAANNRNSWSWAVNIVQPGDSYGNRTLIHCRQVQTAPENQ